MFLDNIYPKRKVFVDCQIQQFFDTKHDRIDVGSDKYLLERIETCRNIAFYKINTINILFDRQTPETLTPVGCPLNQYWTANMQI